MATFKRSGCTLLLAGVLSLNSVAAYAAPTTRPVGTLPSGTALLPTGQVITPTAAPGSRFLPLQTGLRPDGTADAQGAVKTALSPNGRTLLILTSGYNSFFLNQTTGAALTFPVLDPLTGQPTTISTPNPPDPNLGGVGGAEWVFVYDLSGGRTVKIQQINVPNTYNGLAWSPDGQRFYVSGGIDDRVLAYRRPTPATQSFIPDAPFVLLGHNDNQTAPLPSYNGGLLKGSLASALSTGAVAAGLAVSRDGQTLAVANYNNDSLSLINTATRQITREVRFFVPGATVATGEYPFDVAIKSDPQSGAALTAYVSSLRDDEVLAVNVATGGVTRIPVGNQPNKMVLSADAQTLYIANGNSDSVSVIDTTTNQVTRTLSLLRPSFPYKGANPNSLDLSPDGRTLYVTLGGENAVAVVDLASGNVQGRIPTGWYPNSVSISRDGKTLYVVNAKSNSGPNPDYVLGTFGPTLPTPVAPFRNEYTWALEKAGFSVIPVPTSATLSQLSQQVDRNNNFTRSSTSPILSFLQQRIKHVIYVIKENRTYDQVLGDLPGGNGDPTLALFPQPIAPNHHSLAADFATLDNFYDSGETSGVGWGWSTYARTTDFTEKSQSVLYGNANFSALSYEYEGTNRNVNVALPQSGTGLLTTRLTGLLDPTGRSAILPGTKDTNAPEGDGDTDPQAVGGYLWDAVLRAGKTVRNYGVFMDLAYYGTRQLDPTQPDPTNPIYIPISATPFAANLPQAVETKPVLRNNNTDVYYRGFDQKNADTYLFNEWLREFQGYVSNGNLPNLSLVRLAHDHFGAFGNPVANLNTPQVQMADNDYALGKLVEAVSNSPYWRDTVIAVLEDDSQDGPDHIDSHRSIAYLVSAYTKRKAVVSTNYTTVNMLRTIEDLLGIDHLAQTDANAQPMADVFTFRPDFTPYQAVLPGILCTNANGATASALGLTAACQGTNVVKSAAIAPLHNGTWWTAQTRNFDFHTEDHLNTGSFNRLLWSGIKGEKIAYPTVRTGLNLRENRQALLNASTSNQESALLK
ncbi:beta-propeller fold lactonase family protein [Anthocerotibacter panamensis]|uniref:beta-propeller fold lactonase family protein n=1 Tax=Anthocerotibacter panamensis TaxID=2857077 RepID=UPI001C401858|nr:beta-propeller fold lactonase family protein [Anthocerotibacter panamensis]